MRLREVAGLTVAIVGLVSIGIEVVSNSIHSNTNLGIALAYNAGNDECDEDYGPNDLQNFPVLTSAFTTGTTVTVKGSLDSATSTTYRVAKTL